MQAASRLGAEQAAKLCAQYLAPIVKNRQYNFPPLGENLFVGAQARPNEVTYSEDWMRPDFVPPAAEYAAAARRRRLARRRRRPRVRRCPPKHRPTARARDGRHQPRCRPARHDGAARRWLMRTGRWRRAAAGLVMFAGHGRDIRLRLARAEFAATARHPGQRAGLLRDPGADARCQQHPTELAGTGRRRDGRPRDENRAPGLACVADHAAQRRRRPARQRNRQDRHDQPAGFATTSSWRHRKTPRRKASCATAHSFRCLTAAPTRAPSRRWRRCRWCSTAAD